jgi:hypothetical protein
MSGKTKVGLAAALMLVVIAAAPAVQCLGYLASQNHQQAHSCCPQKTTPVSTVVPTCCIHSPAVTSQTVDVPTPNSVIGAAIAVQSLPIIAAIEIAIVPDLHASPPHCSSILRI